LSREFFHKARATQLPSRTNSTDRFKSGHELKRKDRPLSRGRSILSSSYSGFTASLAALRFTQSFPTTTTPKKKTICTP